MPDEINPEDREKLARIKFGEWFNEFFDEKFGEAFEKRFAEARANHPAQQGRPVSPPATTETPLPPSPGRRRSLFEECLSSTLGLN